MASKPSPRLKIVQANGFETEIPLEKDLVRIGRSNEADVIIAEKASSRIHAEISNLDGECYLKDLQSTNGTVLNGTKISEERLRNGDAFAIGATRFEFIDPTDPGRGQEAPVDEMTDDDWEALGTTTAPPKPKDSKPEESLWTPLNIVMMAGSVLVLGFVLLLFRVTNEEPPPVDDIPIDLPLPPHAFFGFMGPENRTHPDKVLFQFTLGEVRDMELSYRVWDHDKPGELVLTVNGNPLDQPPQTGNNIYSELITAPLPAQFLKPGENLILFDNTLVPENRYEFYGVGEISVGEPEQLVCDVSAAEESFLLGRQDYEARKISKANLYRAIRRLEQALDNTRTCEVKPTFFVNLTTLYRQARDEHEVIMEDLWFCVDQAKRTKDDARAIGCLEEILARVPDERAGDNLRATNELRRIRERLAKEEERR